MIHQNKVLQKLKEGKPVIGCQVRSRSAMIAELYGHLGFDYVFIEGEHFPFNIETVGEVICACDAAGIEPILRIPDHDPGKILQCLDMGAMGMLFPHCDTPEQMKAIRDAGKYAPIGRRGFSNTSRATGYGTMPMGEYKAFANENVMLIPFIESKEAVENIDAILALKPDALHLGTGDLSESYGVPISHALVQNAMDEVLKKAEAAGVAVGVPSATKEEAVAMLKRGFRMISLSSDIMLLSAACKDALCFIQDAQA